MNGQKNVLLLIGSPRGAKSTSDSLGTYLIGMLREKGLTTEKILIYPSLASKKGPEKMLSALSRADVIILCSPLYIDSSPSGVIRAMELIGDERKTKETHKQQKFLAIVNCGFPETRHNDIALAIYRQFAREVGFEWLGGFALGGGQAIAGEPLSEAEGKTRYVRKALDLAADALAEGRPVPSEAVELMAKPFVPGWMYTLFGGIGWRWKAMKHGALKHIMNRS